MLDAAEKMDRMYRMQRHFYDFTRKYFLLGRDAGIQRLAVEPGEQILEVGCGTARNLEKLIQLQPAAKYFGLDASKEMLKTAVKKLSRVMGGEKADLKVCFAENLCYRRTFELDRPFDAILFSYTLSMIPTWRESLDAACRNLTPGGRILIVDFWDQRDLPVWFAKILVRWLEIFHVRYRPELMEYLQELGREAEFVVEIEPIWKRYAFVATLHRHVGLQNKDLSPRKMFAERNQALG